MHVITAYAYDKRGRLIAKATNNYKRSHPLQAHFAKLAGQPERVYLHAEVAVLLRCNDKQPHSVYIERFYKNGQPALAAPCPICRAALKAYGVEKITYTT